MTRVEVVELFGLLKAIYQSQFKGDSRAVDVWHRMLVGLERKAVFRAVQDFAMAGGDFAPNCAQLYKKAKTPDGQIESRQLCATSVWREILESHGRTVDPIGMEALRLMGGWRRIGFMPETQAETWGHREFNELYASLAEREENLCLSSSSRGNGIADMTSAERLNGDVQRRHSNRRRSQNVRADIPQLSKSDEQGR
jgi:hypothetical protein